MAEQTALKSVAFVGASGAIHVSLCLNMDRLELTVSAVKVGNSKDISSTALRSAVETRARDISLALLLSGESRDGGSQEGNNSE